MFLERKLITPIVKNLESAGYHVQPTELRALLAAQAKGVGENLPQKITQWGRDFIGKLALSIYEFILILMLTAFIVMDRKSIAEFFASLPPPNVRDEYHTLIRYVDRGLAGVIRGQLVICGVNGLLTYVGLLVIGVQGAWLLGIIAGILSLIPIFGTIISTIPIVLIAAADGLDKGFWALGWIMLIHLLEANLLNPLIMGSHARMHPVIIIFALLAGEHTFGVWGALLAVPTASILQSCFLFYRHEIEEIPPQTRPAARRRRASASSAACSAARPPSRPPGRLRHEPSRRPHPGRAVPRGLLRRLPDRPRRAARPVRTRPAPDGADRGGGPRLALGHLRRARRPAAPHRRPLARRGVLTPGPIGSSCPTRRAPACYRPGG